jgi:hypothetical protein
MALQKYILDLISYLALIDRYYQANVVALAFSFRVCRSILTSSASIWKDAMRTSCFQTSVNLGIDFLLAMLRLPRTRR